jgi:hypothetical protein
VALLGEFLRKFLDVTNLEEDAAPESEEDFSKKQKLLESMDDDDVPRHDGRLIWHTYLNYVVGKQNTIFKR